VTTFNFLPLALATAREAKRVLLVALCLLPLLAATAACLPALVVLPFTRHGSSRSMDVLRQIARWTRSILIDSR
jgi:hypothetical protein